MLTGWRVLDLTDERGEVGPYLLADLGADVIKVEPGGGCPSRHRGVDEVPFHTYNGNKSSIELSGDAELDRRTLLGLLADADLVFDSGPPGRLAELGLDHATIRACSDRLVVVVVTPFGLDGPRAEQPATEFTIAALGGSVRLGGTPERAPVQMSVPQVWRHAGAEAAVAAMIAHRRMVATGQTQYVDVSAQTVMTWTMLNAMEAFEIQGRSFERTGSELHLSMTIKLMIEAADGYVVGVPTGRLMQYLLPWMVEDGIVGTEWEATDWATYDHNVISGEPVNHSPAAVSEAIQDLCRRHTKWDLFRKALTYGATLAPLNTLADLLGFDHLELRGFWETADLAASAKQLRLPGGYLRLDQQRPTVQRGELQPAPLSDQGSSAETGAPWTKRARSAPAPATVAHGADGGGEATNGDGGEPLPLAGLKVVDFSWIGVGPMTAKSLADHGATVVRIESENRLDGLRQQPPYKDAEPGLNRSNFFGSFNTSKLGMSLDLKTGSGLATARRLIEWADVVIESFTPGTIDRLGLGYKEMAVTNPALIMVSTSMLGTGSSASSMAGYGYHAAAIAGFQNLVGWPDLPADGPWLAYTDTIGPRFIVPALLAALDQRRRTGHGCHIEAAQLEIALQLLAPELAEYQRGGVPLVRLGNRDPAMAPQGAYPTKGADQWLAISVTDDDAWSRMVELLGRPEWACDPGLASVAGRLAEHDRIDAELSRWTNDRSGPETEQLLAEHGIAAGVIQSSRDLCQDGQYLHRGFYHYLEHAEVGVVPYAGHQYRIAGYDHGPRTAAPCLGQHTFEILTDLLGMDTDEIAELAAADALV